MKNPPEQQPDGETANEEGEKAPPFNLVLEPTLASIKNDLIANLCISCHQVANAKNRYVDLSKVEDLIGGINDHDHDIHKKKIIKKGCPEQSFFYSIMKEGKMPPSPAPHIDEKNLAKVVEWITSLDGTASCVDDTEPGDDDNSDDDEPD